MAIPGSPAFLLPAGDDEIPRRLRDIERSMMELGPSIAASIKPAMDDIRAQQAITAGLVADLAAQDVVLTAQQATLTAQQATLATTVSDLGTAQGTLAAQQATLTAAVADLASRVSVSTAIDTFNTGSLPNDAAWHEYGADIPITINVPTGRLVVTVGCGEASLNCGGAAVTAEATFSISGGVAAYGGISSRAYLGAGATIATSNSLSVQRAFVVAPGTYTITGKMRAWASQTTTASVLFRQPYLTVQVTG